nr:hypothetical protein [Tanacetum cinerariifolium]
MSKDPSIPRRNKINWHYVRDDFIFSTIKVVSRHQTTQQYDAMLPMQLTNDEIRNTKAYKEYYAFATGEAAPKPKASARRKRSGSDTSITPPTTTTTPKPTVTVTPKLTAAAKGKQPAKNLSAPLEVARTEAQQLKIVLRRSRQQTHISQPGGLGTDEGTGLKPGVPDVPTDELEEELSWNSSDDEGADDQEKVDDDDEGDEGNDREEREEDDDEEDKDGNEKDDDDEDLDIAKDDEQDDTERSKDDTEGGENDKEDDDEETRDEENFDPIPRTPESSEDEGDGEEDQGLNVDEEEHAKEEEEDELYRDVNINHGRGLQVNQEVEDSRVILTPVHPDGQQESSSVSSQFVTNILNPTNDDGMESIFATASIYVAPLPITTPTMTPSTVTTITTTGQAPIPPTPILSEVLQNLPTFASVFRFDDRLKSLEANFFEFRQTNPFAEAVSAILDRGSKRRREGKEPESVGVPLETTTRSASRSTTGSKSRQASTSESAFAEEPVQTTSQKDEPSYPMFERGQRYPHNLLQPLSLIPDNRGHLVIPFAHFINNDLEYLRGGASSRKYTTSVTKTKAADYGHIKWIEDLLPRTMWIQEPIDYDKHALWGVSHWGRKRKQFYGFAVNWESARDVYSKRRIIVFKEGDFKWLRLQDIEDMLLLLVQGKLSNLTVEECFAFNVSLRMFTRSIVIQRRQMEAYTAYSNPRGLIYQNKDKKNRLMWIDERHKFNDETLNDVRTALDDRLKGIRMRYLPHTIWRKSDKDRAAAMIQAIDKMLKSKRIMRSLEKFIGGKLYEGDFQMLQRTI